MSNEGDPISLSADKTKWADDQPDTVNTSYTAQNLNIQDRNSGGDHSIVEFSGTDIKIKASGYIDNNNTPIKTTSDATISMLTKAYGKYYVYVFDGTPVGEKYSYNVTSTTPTWDNSLNAYYVNISGTKRVLNWVINWQKNADDCTVTKIHLPVGNLENSENPNTFINKKLINQNYWSHLKKVDELAGSAFQIADLTFDYVTTNNIIVWDSTNNLYKILDGLSGTVLSSFAKSGTETNNPTALNMQDADLISFDNATDNIYIHSGITATISKYGTLPASINCQDLVHFKDNGINNNYFIFLYGGGTSSLQLYIIDITPATVAGGTLAAVQVLTIEAYVATNLGTPKSISYNWNTGIIRVETSLNIYNLSIEYLNATDLFIIKLISKDSVLMQQMDRLEYCDFTGGLIGYLDTANSFRYITRHEL